MLPTRFGSWHLSLDFLFLNALGVPSNRKSHCSNVPAYLRGTFDGLQHYFDSNTREMLENTGRFHEHKAYTLCCEIDSSTKRVVFAFSSENLLLNAYRQDLLAMLTLLCMDASYRLVLEGHSVFLFGTHGVDHKFHIICMGAGSPEDTAAHRSLYEAVVTEAESLVLDRTLRGIDV